MAGRPRIYPGDGRERNAAAARESRRRNGILRANPKWLLHHPALGEEQRHQASLYLRGLPCAIDRRTSRLIEKHLRARANMLRRRAMREAAELAKAREVIRAADVSDPPV